MSKTPKSTAASNTEAVQKDAARYRALRDRCVTDDPLKSPWVIIAIHHPLKTKRLSGSALDVVVDEAIATTTRGES